MKLNSSISGTESNQNLAHQFYYHIPDPTLSYVDNNLKNFDNDQYKQMSSQKYAHFHHKFELMKFTYSYQQPAQSCQPGQTFDYATGQYIYQQYPATYGQPAYQPGTQPAYSYDQYYQSYYQNYYSTSNPANAPTTTVYDEAAKI
jgi:hypothetical protein